MVQAATALDQIFTSRASTATQMSNDPWMARDSLEHVVRGGADQVTPCLLRGSTVPRKVGACSRAPSGVQHRLV